ncbi:fumarate reductase subunit C [Orbus hercynius]|uniref:Fumarate reductase subunit C n=1 Tax=Orbus hercynius TaxID=593135 RepID=A0A495RCP1_9GAMM|nr:hypothetical protein [Orbus hercynius]RKS85242.1 fumarate reductase subunit C [Orbus hercynius]
MLQYALRIILMELSSMRYNRPDKPVEQSAFIKHSALRHHVYYLIGQSNAFFMLWISIILMFGVICARPNEIGQTEFYRFIFFLQNPIVVVLNSLALLAALYHSIMWFNLFPNVSLLKPTASKQRSILLIISVWLFAIVVSVILLLLVFGYFK